MQKRNLLILILFPVIAAAAFFFCWPSLKQSFVEWTVKEHCRKTLGVEMTFDRIVILKEGGVLLEGVKAAPIADAPFSIGPLTCPEVFVTIEFNLRENTLKVKAHLTDFEWHVPEFAGSGQKGRWSRQRQHIFGLEFALSGDGTVKAGRETHPLLFEAYLGSSVEGAAQIGRYAARFHLSPETCDFGIVGTECRHTLFLDQMMELAQLPMPMTVEGGVFSGMLIHHEGRFDASVEGQSVQVSSDNWKGALPSLAWTSEGGKHLLAIRDGELASSSGKAEGLNAIFEAEGNEMRLRAAGFFGSLEFEADVRKAESEILDGSHLTFFSDDIQGEVVYREGVGYAHAWGEQFEVASVWDHLIKGFNGTATFQDKAECDFSLFFNDDCSFRDGVLSGRDLALGSLPLTYFVSEPIVLSGHADVEGRFNATELHLDIASQNARIDTERWAFSLENQGCAHVVLPFFERQTHMIGTLQEGSLTFPARDLTFQITSVDCLYDRGQWRFQNLKAQGYGLSFLGDIRCIFSPDLEFELTPHMFEGSIEDLSSVFAHFDCDVPFFDSIQSGQIALQEEGSPLRWRPNDRFFEGTASAHLSKGHVAYELIGLDADQLELSFTYDIGTCHLHVDQGTGILSLKGSPQQSVVIECLEWSLFPGGDGRFDVWCGDKNRDWARFCGHSSFSSGCWEIECDPNVTHIGAMYPEELFLRLDPKGEVDRLHLATSLPLDALKENLEFIPYLKNYQHMIDRRIEGNLFLKVDCTENKVAAFLHGKNLVAGDQKFHDFRFSLQSSGNEWHIETLQLDDLSLAADFETSLEGIRIKFMGCQWGDGSLFGLDGRVSSDLKRIDANIHLVECSLGDLKKIDCAQPFLDQIPVSGSLRAGKGTLVMIDDEGEWEINCSIEASLKDVHIDRTPIVTGGDLLVDFKSNEHFVVQGGTSAPTAMDAILFDIGRVELNLVRHELLVKNLGLTVPESQWQKFTQFTERYLKGGVHSSLSAFFNEVQPKNSLSAVIDFQLNPLQSDAKMTLGDGVYCFQGREWTLKNFLFHKVDREISLAADCRFLDRWVQMKTTYLGKSFPNGRLRLRLDDHFLTVWWSKGKTEQLTIDRIEGVVAGADIALHRNGDLLEGSARSPAFHAHLSLDRQQLLCRQLTWTLSSGEVTCPYVYANLDSESDCTLLIPEVKGHGLAIAANSKWGELCDREVVLDELGLQDVSVQLSKPNTLSGKGRLKFSTAPRPGLRNYPLLKEKIQGISAVKPASGALTFDMKEGSIVLTSLTDVVDQRERFRYQLPKERKSVWQLDGNLDMIFHLTPHHSKVRMGELLSIVINGTAEQPEISLCPTKQLAAPLSPIPSP